MPMNWFQIETNDYIFLLFLCKERESVHTRNCAAQGFSSLIFGIDFKRQFLVITNSRVNPTNPAVCNAI